MKREYAGSVFTVSADTIMNYTRYNLVLFHMRRINLILIYNRGLMWGVLVIIEHLSILHKLITM